MTEVYGSRVTESLIRNIGGYGPFALFMLGVYRLYDLPKYLVWFCILVSLNELLNLTLKNTIREPRPIRISNDIPSLWIYGMPSGHAQHSVFLILFMQLVKPSWPVFCASLVILIIVLFERYIDRFHTISQIIVGGILGALFATTSVFILHKRIEWFNRLQMQG